MAACYNGGYPLRAATLLGEHIATLAIVLLYLVSMFGWGSLLLKLFSGWHSVWDDITSRLIAGCGVAYGLFIALGAAGVLHRLEVGVVLGVGTLIAVFFLPSVFRHPMDWKQWEVTDRILVICIGLLALTQVIVGLTPLIFYDLQVYHLLAPAQFLREGSFVHIPWSVYTNSPLALQLTLGMSLTLDSSGQLAKVLFTILGCLVPLGIFQLVRPIGRRAALLAALFVLCFPEFWMMQALGAVDLPIAGLMIFGAFWLRQALRGGRWRDVVLAGIAFGMAVGSRYQALLLTLWIVAALAGEHCITGLRRLPDRKVFLQLGLMLVLIAALLSPWLIRNYAHLGNPVYPLFHGELGAEEWSENQDARMTGEVLGPRFSSLRALDKVLAPFMALLIMPANGLFGMALLLGALIALAQKDRELRLIVLTGLGGLVIWSLLRPTAGAPLLRFNATSIALLLAATGTVLAQRELLGNIGGRIAGFLAGGSLLIATIHVGTFIPVVSSLSDAHARQELQRSNVPSWAAFEYVNEKLDPHRSKVLVIGETRGFWLRVPYLAPSCFNGPQLDSVFGEDATRWTESLARLGVTHLLISTSELSRLHKQYSYFNLIPDRMDAFNRWIERQPLLFQDEHGTAVVALSKPNDAGGRSD